MTRQSSVSQTAQILTRQRKSAPLSKPNAYYRPKTFVAKFSVNSLAAAASPLFTLLIKLKETPSYHDTKSLYKDLVHEVKAFESGAQAQGYRSETVLVARYILCASLDEAIQSTNWGKQCHWQKCNLLMTFQKERSGNQRFFVILDRLSEDPALYIDLLEMMYLCLSLGFEGRYRYLERGSTHLEKIIDDLYHLIRTQRGEFKKSLSTCQSSNVKRPTHTTSPALSFWQIGSIAGVILLTLYSGFNYMLSVTNSPVAQELQSLVAAAPSIHTAVSNVSG